MNKLIFNNLQLVSNKIDTYLTSLWRHVRYLFSVFRGILPAIFRRFSKKLSTSVVAIIGGLWIFFYFGWSGVYFIFILYNCYVSTYHRLFYGIQQNRYVFDVIVTSWALFVFCISWNFARDISTVFEEINN
jgi:hypothetical protein